MKILIKLWMSPPNQDNPYLRWSRYILFVIGILALGYVGFALLDTQLYQADQSRRFEQELKDLKPSIVSDTHTVLCRPFLRLLRKKTS